MSYQQGGYQQGPPAYYGGTQQQTTTVIVGQPTISRVTTVFRSSSDHYLTLSIVMTVLCVFFGGLLPAVLTLVALFLSLSKGSMDDAGYHWVNLCPKPSAGHGLVAVPGHIDPPGMGRWSGSIWVRVAFHLRNGRGVLSERNSGSILYSSTLAHLVGLRLLDEEVVALSGPADVSTGRVDPRVKSTVPDSKFADPQETKEPN
ncbi:hypothetical protein EMCRGX_G007705 [Ephydatia muelleri]